VHPNPSPNATGASPAVCSAGPSRYARLYAGAPTESVISGHNCRASVSDASVFQGPNRQEGHEQCGLEFIWTEISGKALPVEFVKFLLSIFFSGTVWLVAEVQPSRHWDYESKSLTSDFSSFNSATDASILARLKSLIGSPCTISHFPPRTRTGNDEINPFSTL
jgi:hypothetical protein